jgi:hypothetical protein
MWNRLRFDLPQLFTGLAGFTFAVALSGFVVIGLMTRYWADDFCYASIFKLHGFWGAQVYSYLHVIMYASNRFSLTLFSGVSDLIGPEAIRFLPALAVISWMSTATLATRQVGKIIRLPFSWAETLLAAGAVVFMTLYQTPNRFQVLYWRSGMLPYLAPLIVMTLISGLILWEAQKEKTSVFWQVIIAILSFLAGGFSETAAAFQTGFLLVALLAAWLARRSGSRLAFRALPYLFAALVGTLISMVLLLVAPPNHARQSDLPNPPAPVKLVSLSLVYSFDFIRESLRGLPLPSAINLSLFGLLSFMAHLRNLDTVWRSLSLLKIPAAAAACYLLTVCSVAPSVYAESAFPELRALVIPQFALVLTTAAWGWAIGETLCAVIRWVRLNTFATNLALILGLCLLSLYMLRTTVKVYAELPKYAQRAAAWVARDLQIRQAQKDGIRDIQVKALDSISGVYELQPDPRFWINACAADYYGMDAIRTDQ